MKNAGEYMSEVASRLGPGEDAACLAAHDKRTQALHHLFKVLLEGSNMIRTSCLMTKPI